MRIVYLNPVATLGGAERALLEVMAAVRETKASAELHLIVGAEGPLIQQAEKMGVRVSVLPMPDEMQQLGDSALKSHGRFQKLVSLAGRGMTAGLTISRYARRLRETVERLRPTLLHSNGVKFHLLAGVAGLSHIPMLWHIHDFLGARPLMSRVLPSAPARPAAAIAVSNAVAEDARKLLPRVPVQVIYNAVDTRHFSPAPADGALLDRLAGRSVVERGTIRVGLLGTFARWKGQDLFLAAAAHLLKNRPGRRVQFYIIGGPIYQTAGSQFSESELKTQAAKLALGDRIGFIPFQQEPLPVYRALDIVVHASTQPEPFGLTIVEAMACGKAVIVSRAGGAAELFTHGHDAVGVTPGDVAGLASAVGSVLDDAEDRAHLAANARCTAVARFSRPRLGQDVRAIYERYHGTRTRRVHLQPVPV